MFLDYPPLLTCHADPTLVKSVTEINYQLEDRMSRLSFLIHFINSNGVTQKVRLLEWSA